MNSVHIVATHHVEYDPDGMLHHARLTGIEPLQSAVIFYQFRMSTRYVIWSGHRPRKCLSSAVRIKPGVQLQTASMCLFHYESERVIEWLGRFAHLPS